MTNRLAKEAHYVYQNKICTLQNDYWISSFKKKKRKEKKIGV